MESSRDEVDAGNQARGPDIPARPGRAPARRRVIAS